MRAERYYTALGCRPGRHGVSNAFSVYLRDPDGHRAEIYTSDYYTGDPDHPVLRAQTAEVTVGADGFTVPTE